MRKLIVVLTLLVSSFGFISAATPAVASAANCTSTIGGIYFPNGDYAFPHNLTNCTGVNGVEFRNQANYTGFENLSEGVFYNAPVPPNPLVYGLYYAASSYGFTWYRHRICNNANVVKVAYGEDQWRIHNSATGTWGTWYVAGGSWQDIWCYA